MKKFIILLFTCTLVLTLASCSGNSTENANTSSPSSAPVEENHGSPTTSTTVGKLSEVLEEKKVWLLVDNFQWVLDKDSEAVAIVFDEGKVYISPADYTLGEFSKMTDEEILAYTKSNDTHNSDSEELIKKVEESDVFNGRHTVTNTVPLFGSPEADGIIEWFMPKYLEGEYGSPMISKTKCALPSLPPALTTSRKKTKSPSADPSPASPAKTPTVPRLRPSPRPPTETSTTSTPSSPSSRSKRSLLCLLQCLLPFARGTFHAPERSSHGLRSPCLIL